MYSLHQKYISFTKTDLSDTKVQNGKVGWISPSNIALVKYWGKKGNQVPMNASISFTLKEAFTKTSVTYKTGLNKMEVEFYLEGTRNQIFEERIRKYLKEISEYLPFLRQTHMVIHSQNSFPHSSGIASSASGMSALALCLCSIENNLYATLSNRYKFLQKASFLARLGSGSASRSVFPKLALWGYNGNIPNSSDETAVPLADILHPDFENFRDFILIIEEGGKTVSSSAGHNLMRNHPYAETRFKVANENVRSMYNILKSGNLESFVTLVEHEALSLHAMMMTSVPGYMLFKPNTVRAIDRIKEFRTETGLMITFTLDAGANIHLLCPQHSSDTVTEFIESELKVFCQAGKYIKDELGAGPEILSDL